MIQRPDDKLLPMPWYIHVVCWAVVIGIPLFMLLYPMRPN